MHDRLNNIELRSEHVQEILSDPPSWMIKWGMTTILLSLLSILAISWFIKYPDFIPAKVLITTLTPTEKVEAFTSGKIEALFIKNHQKVVDKELLAIIQNNSNSSDLLKISNVIDTLKVNYSKFNFPFGLFRTHSFGDVESDYINFERAYMDYTLSKKLQPFAPETIAGQYSINEINVRLNSVNKQKNIEIARLNLKKKDLNRNQSLFDKGVISAREMEFSRLEYLQAEQNFQNIDLSISQLQETKSSVNRNIIGTSISKQQTESEQFKNLLQSYDQLKKSLKEWDQKYLIRSSIDGTVSFQNFWGINQVVKPGEIIFTILPKNKSLLGRLIVPAQNSGKIKIQQKVIIKLDNYPYQQFGIIEGRIKNISLSPNSDGNYYVEITLPQNLKTSYNYDIKFNKELQGTAEIVTEDLRFIQRFFYQFRQVFQYQ